MKTLQNISDFKQKALHWANQFEVCCFLDSNHYKDDYSAYDFMIAAAAQDELKCSACNAFDQLKSFYATHKQWIFGFFSYDLKNEIEDLSSSHLDGLDFPDLYFFVPKYLIAFKDGKAEVLIGHHSILDDIESFRSEAETKLNSIKIAQRLSKDQYIHKVEALQDHIIRGDIYEINFCQEFFSENAEIDPIQTFEALNQVSPTPFAGCFKVHGKYILSATPERFLCKRGSKLTSQPIKGTAKRSSDLTEDEAIKQQLRNDIKEQAENVMIVDLVRHDLTKSAVKGSVTVDELFGIYSFPQVHQMISTISCELNPEIHFIDAIKNAFPMGSMTGAPKVKAMKLIEEYEVTKRGIYSGSFGCISPDGDFDFNVVIRSILYNAESNYLSFQAGGAITYESDAEKEYEECLLKASAILKVLGN
ncbi:MULTISPECIES: anthranilate synthase component I family protein [unclassified Pedobacter]|uniref:anthranilate synthase component I family protein n=1 Tax=unclassified Pedobacter TaxID=2628915 RepID=UPI00141DB283|nr:MULTISPECIES: anthranilate synthase component I family protein [unclassified Pedobacter]NII83969.1 para-aminobenzoate synthetase component 1 [Pedobacter sp. SG908]NMN37843.1 para-aminobenzoate synthetase component 1 [Pedobacter sp. SG918]